MHIALSCSVELSMKKVLYAWGQVERGSYYNKPAFLMAHPADKCKNANNCWHKIIYEQDKGVCALRA